MNLQRKLVSAFGLVLFFTLVVAGGGLWLNHRALSAFERTFAEDVDHERAVAQLRSHFKTQVQEWKDVLLRGKNANLLDKHWSAFVQQERWVHDRALELGRSLPDSDEQALIKQFVVAHDAMATAYRRGRDEFLAAGGEPTVGDLAVRGVDRAPARLLDELAAHIGASGKANSEHAYALGSSATRWSMVLLAVASVFGLAIAWLLSLSIARPIHQAIGVAGRVAAGDLSRAIAVHGRDEVAQLLRSLAHMQERLSVMVHRVRGGAHSVASASAQIAHGNNDLSERTEQQASALQETAATMEQLGTTVQRSAENARDANQLAHAASSVAERGGVAVGRVVETMSGIQQSSRRIADIIGTIDGIAFQTNILALNAAVEAARAGEQGRGFAVVASEVRALAQRSASAAREIKSLITDSVTRVDEGNRIAEEAGATMEQVVDSIRRVSQMVESISSAADEQRSGIEQITSVITQMDAVTQQNAALVEESAAAAESLRTQAGGLVGSVDVFRLAPAV